MEPKLGYYAPRMKAAHKRSLVALVAVVAIIGGVGFAVGGALSNRGDKAESWTQPVEGFLAVATPCCRGEMHGGPDWRRSSARRRCRLLGLKTKAIPR